MNTTLGISFSKKQCHALLLAHEEKTAICKATREISQDGADKALTADFFATLKPLHTKKTTIIVGISSDNVMHQEFALDSSLSDAEILHFFITRSIDFFGHDAKQLRIDFEKRNSADNKKQIVHVVAAQRQLVDSLQQAFLHAKMTINAIDIDTFALARADHYISQHPEFSVDSLYATALGLCLWGVS